MLDALFAGDGSRLRRLRKTLTLLLSLTAHAAVVAAIIVMPLLRAEAELPNYKSTDVRIISPILPGVPPGPGRGGKPATTPDAPRGSKNPPAANGPHVLMVPIEVPTEIVDEDPADYVVEDWGDGGVVGGTGDGDRPWIINGEVLPKEVDPMEKTIPTVRPPRLIKRVDPGYPGLALAAHISGKVEIEASTDIYGRVLEAHVTSGHALLNGAALEAVKKWIYEPCLVNGIPRPVRFKVTITFSLETR